MATLIQVSNSSGEVGRCDAKCYNAQHPVCTCCCGGLNHGAGFHKALENTAEAVDQEIQAWLENQGGDASAWSVVKPGVQLGLF